jgi:hypothetical protein
VVQQQAVARQRAPVAAYAFPLRRELVAQQLAERKPRVPRPVAIAVPVESAKFRILQKLMR